MRISGVLLVWLALATGAAFAGESHRQLDQLVAEAMKNNREILAAQKRYEAVRQRPRQAGSLPDPTISLGYNSNGNPLPGAGLGTNPTSNIGLMMTQEFPYPGKRRLRENLAGKEAEAEFQQYTLVELNVVARLRQAYYRLQHSYVAREVIERNRELLRRLLRVTEVRYSVGKAAQQDVFRAQTQLSILEARLRQVDRERRSAEAEIDSILDRAPGTPLGRPDEPDVQELTVTLEELYAAAAADSPLLLRGQKMIERSELAVNLARKDYYPDYSLTAGYFNQHPMAPMYMFRADIRIPLYFSRKQRAAVAEQAGTLAEARHNYEAAGQSLRYRIKDDFLAAQTSFELMKIYQDTVIPQARLALESSLASYETGGVDFLPVLNNYVTIVEYEMNYHEEMHNFHLALSRLEELTGLKLVR